MLAGAHLFLSFLSCNCDVSPTSESPPQGVYKSKRFSDLLSAPFGLALPLGLCSQHLVLSLIPLTRKELPAEGSDRRRSWLEKKRRSKMPQSATAEIGGC
ncbi:hypothetical protein Nepgr_029469 [Nepenthes gracilis]|uniref:Secreted protein n=1 Tax=Nepenthes gracilis TaxID=150966 RepID=A0AAD3TE76_NEPGR|nr:hypothetical protein Nepgr_029469 [Nepenthes gracilis]